VSTLRVTRLQMDAEEVARKENSVERRIDNFGDAINGDQVESPEEYHFLGREWKSSYRKFILAG